MAKLRHVAMQVPNLEKASSFYEEVFGMKRLVYGETPYGNVQMMSDGLVTLALLNFPEGTIGVQKDLFFPILFFTVDHILVL